MKLATTLALLAVTLTVLADGPATIRYSFQKDDGTPLAGATIRITPSSTNLQGYSGSVLVPSGKQIVLGSDGKATNQMMVGFYSLQVPAAGRPIGFQVPDTTNSYDFTALVTQGLSAFQYSPLVTQITSRDGSIVITPGNGRGPVDLSVVGGSGGGGTNGVNGTNGLAATISVGTVTTGAAGSSAAVVNTGTSNAAVFAFTIPRGDTGAQGPQGVAGANGADGAQGPQGIPGPVTDFPYTRITNAPWLTPSAADLRYDALNAAHDATNSLGSAAFKATGYFDAAGAGTAAAHDATNTYPWGVLYDAAGAAASAQTASLPLHGTADLALGLYGFTAATNGGPVAGSQVTGPTSTTNGLLSSANAAATYLGLHAKADTAGNADTVTSISGNTVSSSQITTGLGYTPASLSGTNVWTGPTTFSSQLISSNLIFQSTLIANLPTPTAGTFARMYASDAVTSRGVGAYVDWDGAHWRTSESVIATASIPTFMLNCVESGLNAHNLLSTVWFDSDPIGYSNIQLPMGWINGGNGNTTSYISTTDGSAVDMTSGAAGKRGNLFGATLPAIAAGTYYGMGCSFILNQTLVGTNYAYIGFANNGVGGAQTSCSFFLQDPYTNSSAAIAAAGISYTNHWICACAKAGTWTFVDSGFPIVGASATSGALLTNRFYVTVTNGATLFYTNGVLCSTITANQPAVTLNPIIDLENINASQVHMYVNNTTIHVRRATARALP